MKHVLGNLKEQSYEDIMNGEEMKLIKKQSMERKALMSFADIVQVQPK